MLDLVYCGIDSVRLVRCTKCGAIYAVKCKVTEEELISGIEHEHCRCGKANSKNDWRRVKVGCNSSDEVLVNDLPCGPIYRNLSDLS